PACHSLSLHDALPISLYRSSTSSEEATRGAETGSATVLVEGRTLPRPSEDEPIPAPHEGGVTTPDFSIYTVWTSPSEHHLVFVQDRKSTRLNSSHVSI